MFFRYNIVTLAVAESFGINLPEFGLSVAVAAERDDAFKEVRILAGEPLRLEIPSNRDDVVYIGIASEFITSCTTDGVLMVVPCKRPRPDISPAAPV